MTSTELAESILRMLGHIINSDPTKPDKNFFDRRTLISMIEKQGIQRKDGWDG